MDNTRTTFAGPKTTVFTNFLDLMDECKAAQDVVRVELSSARAPRVKQPRGVLAMVDESQCQPVSDVEISEPPADPERP